MRALLTSKWTKVAVFLLCLVPLDALIWRAIHNGLGANPVEFIQLTTGRWTLRFLIITLCITLTYLGPDQSFDLAAIWKDVAKRPFITVGFLGFLLLVPLAITSTAGWIRRLGGKRWQMLHRGIYFAAVAGVIHYYWKVKSDVRMPIFYGVLVGILLLWRLGDWFFKRRRQAPSRVTAPSVSVNG
ncbi:MAG: hypothetical protein AUI12_06605 [Acidobacteria bacterium 13_2_20CM_2_57_6]|nr:MAG: hypothetical protein AUI12_06605 [Acidobacteria bacterium 13_2_20CM_2_57_6]